MGKQKKSQGNESAAESETRAPKLKAKRKGKEKGEKRKEKKAVDISTQRTEHDLDGQVRLMM